MHSIWIRRVMGLALALISFSFFASVLWQAVHSVAPTPAQEVQSTIGQYARMTWSELFVGLLGLVLYISAIPYGGMLVLEGKPRRDLSSVMLILYALFWTAVLKSTEGSRAAAESAAFTPAMLYSLALMLLPGAVPLLDLILPPWRGREMLQPRGAG